MARTRITLFPTYTLATPHEELHDLSSDVVVYNDFSDRMFVWEPKPLTPVIVDLVGEEEEDPEEEVRKLRLMWYNHTLLRTIERIPRKIHPKIPMIALILILVMGVTPRVT